MLYIYLANMPLTYNIYHRRFLKPQNIISSTHLACTRTSFDVATVSRIDSIIGLFCRISSLW